MPSSTSPFLDAFWNLSDDDNQVRAKSGHAIIAHCFATQTPEATPPLEDIRYALERLLKGTCSGRASSRQGYASTLTLFLSSLYDPSNSPLLDHVFPDDPLMALLATITTITSPPQSAIKGSEQRDFQFGHLFTLLAVGRSRILAAADADTAKPFVDTAIALYNSKKWMRESAVSAIVGLYESLSKSTAAEMQKTVLALFIAGATNDDPSLLTLKLALSPQSLSPKLLSQSTALLTSTTSCFPRLHSIWPTILPLLTPGLLAQIQTEVLAPLTTSTNERKALPLLLLPPLLSSPNTQAAHIPNILTPNVTRLLLNAATKDTKNPHTLHSLATQTLKELKSILTTSSHITPEIRLTVIAALLKADAKFDAKTRTDIVATVLGGLTTAGQHQYVDFLLTQLQTSMSDSSSDTRKDSKGKTASTPTVDALLAAARLFMPKPKPAADGASNETAEATRLTPVVDKIYSFFMAAAFFDCREVVKPVVKATPKKGKKGKKEAVAPVSDSAIITNALLVGEGATVPYQYRSAMSSAFFSLLSDLTVSCYQTATSFDVMRRSHKMWLEVEQGGGTLWRGELGEDCMQARVQVSEVCEGAKSDVKGSIGVANLAMGLSLQLLNEGADEGEGQLAKLLDEEENVDEEVVSAIGDLVTGAMVLLSTTFESVDEEDRLGGDDDALAVVADVCVSVLAMGTSAEVGRGGSVKALREAVKRCWSGVLGCVEGGISVQACKVLVESVCGAEEDEEEDMEEEDMEEDEDENDEMELDGGGFGQLGELGDDNEKEEEEEQVDSDSDSDSDSSIEINPDALSSMLLEDDDEEEDSDNEDGLLHHEGADGALAHMIKTSQASRKKGKQHLEQLDMDHKIRCLSLLEAILNKNKLGDNTFSVILPLLNLHKTLVNATNANHKLSATGVVASKKSMLEKLTKLFTTRVVKAKVGAGGDVKDAAKETFKALVEEAYKSPSRDHASCVSLGLVLCCKSNSKIEGVEAAYAGLAEDWATKKNSKVYVCVFEDLLARGEGGGEVLVKSMVKYMKEGRSDFVRSECFRLGGKIFEAGTGVDVDVAAVCKACKESLVSGLKSKRIKDVLGCVVGLVAAGKKEKKGAEFWGVVEKELVEGLKVVGSDEKVMNSMSKVANQVVADIAECSLVAGEEAEASGKDKKGKGKLTPKKKNGKK